MSLHHHKYEVVENVRRHELPREFVSWSFFKIRARNLRPNAGKLQTRNFRSVISSLDVRFKIWGLKLSILSSVRLSLCVHARISNGLPRRCWLMGNLISRCVRTKEKNTSYNIVLWTFAGAAQNFWKIYVFFQKFCFFFSPSLFGAKLFRVYSAKTESIRQDPSLFGCKTNLFGKNRVHSVAE